MFDELDTALERYHQKWHELVAERQDKAFFETLKPIAVGWKVADQAEYSQRYAELRGASDKIIETWMNGRWIAKMHLRERQLAGNISLVKLMQRRPGSSDTLGLDHLDFYSPTVSQAEQVLKQETNLKWTHESNDVVDIYNWISVWFADTEAKLKDDTVLDIIIAELKQLNAKIIAA